MKRAIRILGSAGLTFPVVFFLGSPSPAVAQDYPTKPIRFVVPYLPGGSSDTMARIFAQKLTESWGQQVVVDNRAGAGANLGTGIVARSPADGYTLLMGSTGPNAVNATLYSSLPFDPLKSFAPITLLSTSTSFLTVNLGLPVRSVKDLIALAKAKPDELSFGSAGNGSSPHIAGELFNAMAGVQMRHIPYKSSPPGLTDLMGGRIQVFFPSGANAVALIRADKIRALAVANRSRSPLFSELPTVAEAGIPGYEVEFWFGLLAPAGTPHHIVDKLNKELNRILQLPEIRERLAVTGDSPRGSTAREFADVIKSDIGRWGEIVRKTGAKPD